VLPLSTFDDHIRWAAASTIYRDPMFTAYAIQANPPIHIIVENGKVTLKGVVATPMEKQIAETKVRHPDLTGLFRGVDEIRMSQKMVAAVANGW